jgi:Tfp pilus assembly protein PilF
VVITPNFDNLPAETLGALGKKIPIVIGHSAITDFARPTLRRPLIIKFHHDFLLSPKSAPKDVDNMGQGYSEALSEIFRLYTPIVVGYGGNDGSLMGFLESLPEKFIPGGIQWCWRKGDPPGKRIEAVVSKQAGTLIEISGFDELMTLLEAPFGHVFNPNKLSDRANARAKELAKAKGLLMRRAESIVAPAPRPGSSRERGPSSAATATTREESSALLDALNNVAVGSNSTTPTKITSVPWWQWLNRIITTADLKEQERLFEEGLKATNDAHQLLGNYAIFLETKLNDHARAEHYFLKAISAAPNRATPLGNYARFLQTQRNDYARAEDYYLRAIALDSSHSNNLGNYALFLQSQRKDDDRAEEYYLKALAADPNHANNLGNYASFLHSQRKDDARAEEYYLKALAADPNDASNLGNYANFVHSQRKDDARAEEYYLKALAADPKHANNLGNYAQFLIGCGRFHEAQQFVEKAWSYSADCHEMGVAEILFSRWLLATLNGNAGQEELGHLKTLLQTGYHRYPWSFDNMLAGSLHKLTDVQGKLAQKLAAAILDDSSLADLNSDPVWNAVTALPINPSSPEAPGAGA